MYSGCTSVLMMHIYCENEPVFCGISSFQRMHQYTDDASILRECISFLWINYTSEGEPVFCED